ncbi:MAG: 5-formyltetrahydrofolate cyclo-ligase [Tissierellia bacterium]|jgi:5-formyltetrahydrofolate cyclo-ligase|nr:5-formyltetrahydrofolate cyclo-ligase [Tissierellia bacterium]
MSELEKKSIREAVLRKRGRFFTQDNPIQASQEIIKKLKTEPAYTNAKTIMCFVSFGTEVLTHEFIQDALAEGKRIFVPYIRSKKEGMLASELKDFSELEIGYFNILAPKEEYRRITDEQPDLVIVPSVAFSKNGYRVGYGGGFYDRYLGAQETRSNTIGIGYHVQVVDEVPVESFDIPIDKLITEEAVIDFRDHQ